MKLGIVGNGVVGSATARCYLEHVDEVRVYDELKERRTHTLEEAIDTDFVFVCLPTPQKKDGSCDVSIIDEFFSEAPKGRRYVLRSTVPVGTTERLYREFDWIVHSPEFLTARCAHVDAQIPSRNIVGYPWAPNLSTCPLAQLYLSRFPGTPLHTMFSNASEAVKLIQNSFFATKVAFFNEAYSFCQKLGIDWDAVMRGILADGRIVPSHTRVPGPDGKRGFGGACLPKDLASYVHQLHANGLPAWVAQAAILRNKEDRSEAPKLGPEAVPTSGAGPKAAG